MIVPFHRGLPALERVIAAVAGSSSVAEIIIVANGHDEDLTALLQLPRVQLLSLAGACGPAVARNSGAKLAAAAVLVFIDADVVPHATAIPRMLDHLRDDALAAVFGAYDHAPDDKGFFSQYRNLAHAFVHERARPEAKTFWAGLGAVHASAFASVGGFDERFVRPSIEDIDLGYRLSAAGYCLRLDVSIRGTHLKRWTLRSGIVTDVRDRGVPWAQAMLKYGALANDLNVSWSGRAAVALAYALAGAAMLAFAEPDAVWVALAALAAFIAVQGPLLRSFFAMRGLRFALGVVAGQWVHHLCNGVSLLVGVTLWMLQRAGGWRTSWTLPQDPWPSNARHARM